MKAALVLDPKYADPLEGLGQSSLDKGDAKTALDYLQRALAADPRFGDTLRMKASILVLQAERLETDPARKAALEQQADALIEQSFQPPK